MRRAGWFLVALASVLAARPVAAQQGWSGTVVPEAAGGLGLSWVEAAVLLEEVGAHAAPAPVAGTLVALVAGALLASGVARRPRTAPPQRAD